MNSPAPKTPLAVEPDLDFIREITSAEGDSLKKCYQCATCSVTCSLSPDRHPFPRKEMIYASWGLKDKLMGDPDIWLCHNCGDCSARCPRGARPGDVLNAIRKSAIHHYSKPAWFNKLLNRPELSPLLFILPAAVILAAGVLTGLINFTPAGRPIVFADFFPVALIEIIFIPLSMLSGMVFLFGLNRFIRNMKTEYSRRGVLPPEPAMGAAGWAAHLVRHLLPIVKHEKFADCQQQANRKTSHIMVSFSVVSLAFVAGVFALALYLFNSHAPYSQANPVKILANVSGLALIFGSLWLMADRYRDRDKKSSYFDWYLLVLVLCLGVTGMMTQLTRLMQLPLAAYTVYFIHLVLAFNLIAFLPFSKLAHVVYRTAAITFDAYMRPRY